MPGSRHRTEVLTQEEIDALLTAIATDEDDPNARERIRDLRATIEQHSKAEKPKPFDLEAFEEYLTKREFAPERPYGLFDKDVSVLRYFDLGKNEELLEDIKQKNEQTGAGNIAIPNTGITLINYSFCPQCKTIYSFKDVVDYYKNPKPDMAFKNRVHQCREDTRVCCAHCGAYFLPSLIIADGTPKNETQFLCRLQTIDAVEAFFANQNMRVLTKKKSNLMQQGNMRAIRNDVYLKTLEKRPTLITNMLQYTPMSLMLNFINGSNVEKGDILFNQWKQN
jgi:hypothetical protein